MASSSSSSFMSMSSISLVQSRRSVVTIILLLLIFSALSQLFDFQSTDLVSIALEVISRAISSSIWRLCIANLIILSLLISEHSLKSEEVIKNIETTDHSGENHANGFGTVMNAVAEIDELSPIRTELQEGYEEDENEGGGGGGGEEEEEEEEEEEYCCDEEEFNRKIEEYIEKVKMQMKMENSALSNCSELEH